MKILMKYGGYEVEDPEILKSGGRIFPNRTATFKEFVQFIIHGKEDFKDDPDVIYKGERKAFLLRAFRTLQNKIFGRKSPFSPDRLLSFHKKRRVSLFK